MTDIGTTADQRADHANATRMALTERLVNRGIPLATAIEIIHEAWWTGWEHGYAKRVETEKGS